jgi:NTP pyrophosphatase (non-canonical NTP hydrolase)
MTFSEYQAGARRTQNKNLSPTDQLTVAALGMSGEAGEIADNVKKYIGQGHALDDRDLIKEMGDVLWYLALMCDRLHLTMEDVAILNIEKLKKRYPEGFTVDASVNRRE